MEAYTTGLFDVLGGGGGGLVPNISIFVILDTEIGNVAVN